MQTVQRRYRVDHRKIAWLRFMFEGYDGIATLTTIDAQQGAVAFQIAPGCEDDFEQILAGLAQDMLIEPLSD